jgi:hypothetical protein
MKNPYKHATVVIEEPAPGHFVVSGHNPKPYRNEDGATVVPMPQADIAREVPSCALIHILNERGDMPAAKKGAAK